MNAHRIEVTLDENKTLTLRDLPFRAGAIVEVIVLETKKGDGTVEVESTLGVEELVAPNVNGKCEDEDWLDAFLDDIHDFWAKEGARPDIPRDWGANFDRYKPSLLGLDD